MYMTKLALIRKLYGKGKKGRAHKIAHRLYKTGVSKVVMKDLLI